MKYISVRNKMCYALCLVLMIMILTFMAAGCNHAGSGKDAGAGEDAGTDVNDNINEEASAQEPSNYWEQADADGVLVFATEDIDGKKVSSEDLKEAKLVLVNFWEPWCGPCVSEMPDLEKLYEKYKDQGFLILGAYSSAHMDAEAKSIMKDCGTAYPIVRFNSQFMPYMTGYYPTSFFADGSGKILSREPIVGVQTYEDWEKMITGFLNR